MCQRIISSIVAIAILFVTTLAGQTTGQSVAQAQIGNDLQIKIISEGFLNNARKHVTGPPIVEVRDRNNRPLAGVTVTFLLPPTGPGGVFPVSSGGSPSSFSNVLKILTNAKGRTLAQGLRPNNVPGAFQMQVTAEVTQGTQVVQSASAVIAQANPLTSAALPAVSVSAVAPTTVIAAPAVSATAVGISTTVVVVGVAAAAAGGTLAGAAAAGIISEDAPTQPMGSISNPGAPVFGPAAVVGVGSSGLSRSFGQAQRLAAVPSHALASPRALLSSPDGFAPAGQDRSNSRLSPGARAGLIVGVAAGASIGTWLYQRHRSEQQVVLTPDEIRFREVEVGLTANAAIILYNKSASDVVVESITASEFFRITSVSPAPVTIAPGQSATFRVAFAPTYARKARESITFQVAGAGRRWSKSLVIDGTGIAETSVDISSLRTVISLMGSPANLPSLSQRRR